jgi:cytochrome bd ubiquinol oxidase subunit I
MHYPWWHVPFLTAPMLIAMVAVVHVMVSHYAVGGGLFLAVETAWAYRMKNAAYLDYLRQHAWFFILITVVFGAITGVGIWWIIGLASPLATEMLIHAFVFGWAIEYVFFVLEIAAAFIFFYYWGRLDEKTHTTIGWIYAWAAWISLVLITGITGFMLNPGSWPQHQNFWVGFLNPQFLPQVLARTGGAFLLASLYVFTHASFKVKDINLRNMIESRSARPALAGAVMILIGGLWWYLALPASAQAALSAASALNILMLLIFLITVAVFVMMYLGPYRNPGWLTPGFAIFLLGAGLAAVGCGEFIREAVRKPYVVYNVVLSNQVYPEEIHALRTNGYLEMGVWTKAYVRQNMPFVFDNTEIDETLLSALPHDEQVELGEVLFMHHCGDCHASGEGYSGVKPMLRGSSPEMVADLVRHPEKRHFFMPPWCGTDEEALVLATYLETLAAPSPPGMNLGPQE